MRKWLLSAAHRLLGNPGGSPTQNHEFYPAGISRFEVIQISNGYILMEYTAAATNNWNPTAGDRLAYFCSDAITVSEKLRERLAYIQLTK